MESNFGRRGAGRAGPRAGSAASQPLVPSRRDRPDRAQGAGAARDDPQDARRPVAYLGALPRAQIENGEGNPTVLVLENVARGLGAKPARSPAAGGSGWPARGARKAPAAADGRANPGGRALSRHLRGPSGDRRAAGGASRSSACAAPARRPSAPRSRIGSNVPSSSLTSSSSASTARACPCCSRCTARPRSAATSARRCKKWWPRTRAR